MKWAAKPALHGAAAATGLELAMIRTSHPAAAGETFLVSDRQDLSMPKLIRLVAKTMNWPARLLPFPLSLPRVAARLLGWGDSVECLVGSLQVDSRKATQVLGWKPRVVVEEGLRRTVEWYLRRGAWTNIAAHAATA